MPIKENINKLKALLADNKKVILISDMYLPQKVIRQMLYEADPILADLKLYLSSNLGFMKSTSELFKYVKTQENIEYKNWIHIGDNKHADYLVAKKLGINAILYESPKLESYEQELLSKNFFNPSVQLTLGCAKNLKLNVFCRIQKQI